MLINGDLIRIPQGTVIMASENKVEEIVPLAVATKPRMGIVIETKIVDDGLIKVLLDDEIFLVDKRVVQLVGG